MGKVVVVVVMAMELRHERNKVKLFWLSKRNQGKHNVKKKIKTAVYFFAIQNVVAEK